MKKLLKVLLCLFLAVTVFIPKTQAEARGDYPNLEDVQIDANGVITWKEVSGAFYYNVYFPVDTDTSYASSEYEPRFDFDTNLRLNRFGTGDYRAEICALDEYGMLLANSYSPVYHFVQDNVCPKPSNVHWDGYKVCWNKVEGYDYDYVVSVYEDGTGSCTFRSSTDGNAMDVSEGLIYKDTLYYAEVRTSRAEWANSDPAATDKKAGRFTVRDITLTVSEDGMGSFADFRDDEGNLPGRYYISIRGEANEWGGSVFSDPFNVKDLIIQMHGETGTYVVTGYALTSNGYRLSNYSSDVSYDYVKQGDYIDLYLQAQYGYLNDPSVRVAVKGQPVSKPRDPEPYWGYTFTGKWYTDEACTQEWDFTKPVTEEFTLYAGFEEKTYTISAVAYPAEGGKVSINGSDPNTTAGPVTVTQYSSYVSLDAAANEGYTFIEWRKNSPDGEVFATWPSPGVYAEDDATYYAIFAKGYRVTFYNFNGEADTVIVDAGSTITLPEYTDATPPGQKFCAWVVFDSGMYGKEYSPGETITVNEDLEISPVFDAIPNYVKRLSGKLRYDTSLAIANELKATIGVEKFNCVVLATGENFADALGGGYLAAHTNAPILLTKPSQAAKINKYINENLSEYGTVYVLGGEGAVPEECLAGLNSSFNIRRLSGKDRYVTNMKILEEVGMYDFDILVCSGRNYADALAASATGRPLLLVDTKKNVLSEEQKAYLAAHPGSDIYIIGGTGAVSEAIENELKAYGNGNLIRLSGSGRYETSVAIAEEFFWWTDRATLAYANDYPDGLCAGPLGFLSGAPILLTKTRKEAAAQEFCSNHHITNGYVTGGAARIPDDTAKYIFNVTEIK